MKNPLKFPVITERTLPENPDTRAVYRLTPNNPNESFYWERVDRNVGWITRNEQEMLRAAVIGIAGCGGMGGMLAERFLRLGVGEIRIADPEVFDISNINRQFGATRQTVGKSKAFETARMLRDIVDDTTLVVYPQGISEEVVNNFLNGCDVVCDEIEFWAVGSRILLHQRARALGIPIFNCNTVGFGTRLFLFTPESATMEECLGMDYEEARNLQERIREKKAGADEVQFVMKRVIEGLVPELPEYCENSFNRTWVQKRLFEEGKAPIIATNPAMATGFLADHVLLHILLGSEIQRKYTAPPPMPAYLFLDAATLETKTVRGGWWGDQKRRAEEKSHVTKDSIRDVPVVAREARKDEMDSLYALRYQIFCKEMGFIQPEGCPQKIDRDTYDDRAYHLVLEKNGKIISYARLILPRSGERFLIEESVQLPATFERTAAVEVSRGLVIPEERGSATLDELIAAIFTYCRTHGYRYLLSFSNEVMLRNWKKRKVRFHFIGEQCNHHGFKTWPLIIYID